MISGRKALPVPIPAMIAQTTALVIEFVADRLTRRPPAATVEGVRIAMRSKSLSCEKSRRELGYNPHTIELALREVVASVVGTKTGTPPTGQALPGKASCDD